MGTRRLRRWFTFIALAAMLAGFGLVPARTSAQGSGQLLWDDEGAAFATFGPNESVTIAIGTIGFECDGFFPTADVYVTTAAPGLGDPLSDVNGSPNTVLGGSSGLFSDTIAFTAPDGNLGPGTYSVVYDECQNKKLDATDTVFHDVFEVREATESPPVASAITDLKAKSAVIADRYLAMQQADVIGTIERIDDVQYVVQCAFDFFGCLSKLLADNLLKKLFEQLAFAAGVPLDTDPKLLAKDALADNIKHYRAIANDPPDPAFRQTTVLTNVETIGPYGASPITAARSELANAHAQDAALAEALLHSIERYQGAANARSGSWARVHARHARVFADLLAQRVQVTKDALRGFYDEVAADAPKLDQIASNVADGLEEVATSGLRTEHQRTLLGLGFDRAQIADALADLPDPQPFSEFTTANALVKLDEAFNALTDVVGALEHTAIELDRIIAKLDADPLVPASAFPTAEAGGPYSAAVGAPITLEGNASDPQGGVDAVEWDLDRDGSFDDASGATPTVTLDEAFDGLIGVRVTDAEGHVSVDYARAEVTRGAPPTTSFTPTEPMPVAEIGTSSPFAVDASDPDGDPLEIKWRLDGADVGTGPSYDYVPAADDAGPHVLESEVSDGRSTIVHAWAPSAVLPDADGDGWRANVDCDDADAKRNPGLAEIGGNGIDDDCESITIDDQPSLGDGNIITHPDAEAGTATASASVVPVAGWQTTGRFTLGPYSAVDDGSAFARPPGGAAEFGNQFFYGGIDEDYSTATQLIDLSAAASAIDTGGVTFDLSAWIGGWGNQEDWGKVHAEFRNASDAALSTSTIGPVTAAERGRNTKLLFRSTSGAVPVGTRKVQVRMEAQRLAGANDDGWFDNLHLSLNGADVDPVAPTLEPVGDLVVAEGSIGSVTVTAAGSDDITLTASDLPSYATFTDNGDGTATFTASPADDAEATVVVSACSVGGCQRRTLRILGTNVAPEASLTPVDPITQGAQVALTAAQDDPGQDTFTYAFDCEGDGSFADAQDASTSNCAYPEPGTYEASVRVLDDDGDFGDASTTVLVRPEPVPVAEIAHVDDVEEGDFVRFDGRASSYPYGDPLTFAWEQTSGPAVELSSATVTRPSFIAPDNGEYAFRLTVSAGGRTSEPGDVAFAASNVAPSVEVTNNGPVDADQPVTIEATASDPGRADTHTYAFDCEDDGTFGEAAAAASSECAFSSGGEHVVRVRATDDDGGVGTGTTTVQVDEPEPACSFTGFSSPVDNPPVINVANAGRTVPLKYRLDCPVVEDEADPAHFEKVTSAKSDCGSLGATGDDAVETYAGSSGLQYHGDGNWQFNWATPKSYASPGSGPCRVMTLRFTDGSEHQANFRFR